MLPVKYELDMYVFEARKDGTFAIKAMPVTSEGFVQFSRSSWGGVGGLY